MFKLIRGCISGIITGVVVALLINALFPMLPFSSWAWFLGILGGFFGLLSTHAVEIESPKTDDGLITKTIRAIKDKDKEKRGDVVELVIVYVVCIILVLILLYKLA